MTPLTTTPASSLLTPANHTLVMIDHQSQMAFATRSIDVAMLRSNAAMVAKASTGGALIAAPSGAAAAKEEEEEEEEGKLLTAAAARRPRPLTHLTIRNQPIGVDARVPILVHSSFATSVHAVSLSGAASRPAKGGGPVLVTSNSN